MLRATVGKYLDADVRRAAACQLEKWKKTLEQVAPAQRQRGAETLDALKTLFPQLEMSGFRNVWVVKPAAKSRGRGIFCENRLHHILAAMVEGSIKDRWVC